MIVSDSFPSAGVLSCSVQGCPLPVWHCALMLPMTSTSHDSVAGSVARICRLSCMRCVHDALYYWLVKFLSRNFADNNPTRPTHHLSLYSPGFCQTSHSHGCAYKVTLMQLRVASLLPSATDTVVALGCASWVVARSHEVRVALDFAHMPPPPLSVTMRRSLLRRLSLPASWEICPLCMRQTSAWCDDDYDDGNCQACFLTSHAVEHDRRAA